MYSFIKTSLKKLIPKRILLKNELFFRSLFAQFYKGKNCQCNVCGNHIKSFIKTEKGKLLCPFCGSISRNRALWNYLNEESLLRGRILHFSPSRSLYRLLKNNKTITYLSSDFENEFYADHRFDITKIQQEDNSFDLIICFHVLEHIENDHLAIQELFRVLKPGGKAIIQTPFKTGETYENMEVTSSEERKLHFGQEDHVRIYSIEGLRRRIDKVGFKTSVKNFKNNPYFGIVEEPFIIATKGS